MFEYVRKDKCNVVPVLNQLPRHEELTSDLILIIFNIF